MKHDDVKEALPPVGKLRSGFGLMWWDQDHNGLARRVDMAQHARSLEPVRRLTGGTYVQCSRDDAPAWPQVPHRRPPVQPSKQSHSTVKKRPNAALCAICTEIDTCFIAGDAMKLLFRASEEAAASPALCACEGENIHKVDLNPSCASETRPPSTPRARP